MFGTQHESEAQTQIKGDSGTGSSAGERLLLVRELGARVEARRQGSVRSASVELDRIGGSGRTLAAASAAHAVDVGSAGVEIPRPLRSAFSTAAAAHAVDVRSAGV